MAYGATLAVTIDFTKVPGALTNFPVRIVITNNNVKTTGNGGLVTNANGYDVVVFSDLALTTPLKFERTKYDASAGIIVLYVKIPSLSASVNTVFYVGVGNAAVTTDQADPTNVWDSNFKGVYHFGDGTTLSVLDSTSNGSNLTNGGGVAGSDGADGSIVLVGASSQYAERSSAVVTSGAITLEALFNPTAFANPTSIVTIDSSTAAHYTRELNVSSAGLIQCSERESAGSLGTAATANAASLNVWNYAAGVFASTTSRLAYLNGGTAGTNSTSQTSTPNATRLTVGARAVDVGPTRANYLSGAVGEVRVSNVARSANWINTTYNNLVGSGFYSVAPVSGAVAFRASSLFFG